MEHKVEPIKIVGEGKVNKLTPIVAEVTIGSLGPKGFLVIGEGYSPKIKKGN